MSQHTLTRAATVRPQSINEAARTAELVIATATDPGDGLILSLRQLPAYGPAPVPVLMDHLNNTAEMAGRLRDLRIERGQLIGVAQFTDAPAADAGWQLARSGVGVSVGASYSPDALQPQPDGSLLVTTWRLREASLTPVPADPAALVRSASPLPLAINTMDEPNTTNVVVSDAAPTAAELKAERAHQRLENVVLRAAQGTQLAPELVDQIIAAHRGRPEQEALTALVREHRQELERRAPVTAGHPARIDTTRQPGELEAAITRAINGQAIGGDKSMVQILREHGYSGRTGADVVRQAFTGRRPDSWLSRGFHSTSDAKDLLLSAGDRRLQEQFSAPARGILEIARIREIPDFREVSILDVGLVGAASKILEGGEIKYKSLADSAGKYKASRYGLGLAVSFEALKNDDLGGLDQVLAEAGTTMLEAEADALAALLTTGANGATAPDGKAIFHADHANSITGALDIAGVGDAVKALRSATSIGGRRLWLQPGFLLCGPERETEAAQLLTETWAATTSSDTNPWKLRLIVEPSLTGDTFYVVAEGPRRPLELGRMSGLPRMMQEEDFDTSAMKSKVEHAFGCAVADHRVIVRVKSA